jgi:uncharacterized protein YrrD
LAVSTTQGEQLGRIQDVVFHTGNGQITGFLVNRGGLFTKAQFLPVGLVQSLGADALLVQGAPGLEETDPAQTDPSVSSAKSLTGRAVLNEAGAKVGEVADVLVDADTLTVRTLLLSTSLLDNVLHGKPQLPLAIIKAVGKDSLVVPTDFDPKAPA